MKKLLLALLFVPLFASTSFAASKSTCPDKVIDKGTIEGIFQGVECGGSCWATLVLPNGEKFSLIADEDEVEKTFGKGTGQKVSVAFTVQQFWNEPGNECSRVEVMESGKVLAAAPATPAPVAQASAAPAPAAASSPAITGKTHTNSIGMEFVLIPAGSFDRMSESTNEFGEKSTKAFKTTISKPFYLGKYEVTQEQWVAVMGSNPSKMKGRTNPVESMSWNDVQEFIKRLNAKEGFTRYRLPTEMEWELAARAGTSTEYFWGNYPSEEIAKAEREITKIRASTRCFHAYTVMGTILGHYGKNAQVSQFHRDDQKAYRQFLPRYEECERDVAKIRSPMEKLKESSANAINSHVWYQENSGYTTHPVGQLKPNPWGLYDIYGNVWEWVQDSVDNLPAKDTVDYCSLGGGPTRVYRGGSWDYDASRFRSASRSGNSADYRRSDVGFRLALSPE